MARDATGTLSQVDQLEKLSIDLLIARADLEPVINICLESATSSNQPAAQNLYRVFKTISSKEYLYTVLGDLASLLSISLVPNQTWIVTPWTLLADLTKQKPYWRQLFGPLERIPREDNFDGSLSGSKECILKVALQLVQLGSVDSVPTGSIRPVLRLIANCCADNNVNRSLVINSSGLDALQSLVQKGMEVDVLLPTLYNVCTGFDEPALNENGQPYRLVSDLAEADLDAEYLTMAEARLQIWKLLDLDDRFLEGNNGSVLADLMEMSSRSALFDISILLRNDTPAETKIKAEEDLKQAASLLSHRVLLRGRKIACTSMESQASICQTCLNLYSQPLMQAALAQSSRDLELFMDMPYLTVANQGEGEDEDKEIVDLSPYRESFLKQLYAVSALPEYQKLASPDCDLLKSLTRRLESYETIGGLDNESMPSSTPVEVQKDMDSPEAVSWLGSVLALFNNALCNVERIEAFLNHPHHSNVCKTVMVILLHANTQAVIFPALSLVNRFALCPTGARRLYLVDHHFRVISRLLKHSVALRPSLGLDSRAQGDLNPIQREVITLARLLIKSSSASASPSIPLAFVQNPVYHDQILNYTDNPASRLAEVARLNISILRTVASSSSSSSGSSAGAPTAQIAGTITNHTNLPLLISSLVSFLLAKGNGNRSGNSEALFGLAIFASIFIAPLSAYHNATVKPALLSRLVEDQEQVISLFQNVADTATVTTSSTTDEEQGQGQEKNLGSRSTQDKNGNGGTGGGGDDDHNNKADVENLQILLTHLLSTSTAAAAAAAAAAETQDIKQDSSTTSLFLDNLKAIAVNSLKLEFGSSSSLDTCTGTGNGTNEQKQPQQPQQQQY